MSHMIRNPEDRIFPGRGSFHALSFTADGSHVAEQIDV